MHMEFPRYLNDKEHEAGYDAYVTGLVFLKLHSYLGNIHRIVNWVIQDSLLFV